MKFRNTVRAVCEVCQVARRACVTGLVVERVAWNTTRERSATLCVRCVRETDLRFTPASQHRPRAPR